MGRAERGPGFFSGLIFGSIIGIVFGFFISQKSDKGTLGEKLKDLAAQGRETIREAIEEGRDAAARKEAELRGELGKEDK